jgi:hypothetical protein
MGIQRKEDGNDMSPSRAMPSVHRESLRGSTIPAHDREITPIARLVTVAWPGGRVLWQTPVAIEVRERGQLRRIPIHDATPRAILVMALAEAVLGALIWRALTQRKMTIGRSKTSRRRTAWTR